MIKPHLFLCSDATIDKENCIFDERKIISLNSLGVNSNITLKIENVANVFAKHLSCRLLDLLEIATYVYAGDCATSRGTAWANNGTNEAWERDFYFIIPVRDLEFWSRTQVKDLLKRIILVLSNDNVNFEFQPLSHDREKQEYLQFGQEEDWPFRGVDRVLLFSGGLDSLSGAVETASQGQNLVLVSHRTVPSIYARQRKLFNELKQFCNDRKVNALHVPVWINTELRNNDSYQRTRSFLYSTLGVAVAESVHARGVRFFENGVVSLNLPVADEVLRARASQTTHPAVLHLFTELFSLVLDRDFSVDNPFIFKTKKEVVQIIANREASHLIGKTCSCAHTLFQSKNQWHCGTCSQCIDRRIAIISAGLEKHDLETDYVNDVFTGKRKPGYEQNMAVNFVRHGLELNQMNEDQMAQKFNLELTRATRYSQSSREDASELIYMHQRHGETVKQVVSNQLKLHAEQLLAGELNDTSMLAKVAGQEHCIPSWCQYATKIISLLNSGVPIACKTHKPKDEPHLQEMCDGILQGHGDELIREFPFMGWSSSKTKPDWSIESLSLWVELKYIRQKTDIRNITEDIAADITKYGDNQRYVLFVIYDPNHLIIDEIKFSREIISRPTMQVNFIR